MSTLANIREAMPLKTPSGMEHGLVKVVGNSVPDSEGKRFKEKDRVQMKKLREEDSKMIKAIYLNTKGNNFPYELTYCEWDGDPLLSYKFLPENEYEIPQGLYNKVNKHRIWKRSELLDAHGRPTLKDTQEIPEHRFVKAE